MTKRYQNHGVFPLNRVYPKLAWALRDKLREGYKATDLRADLMAGIIVGLVAIPLGMALGIASGVPPEYGLYTVIFGGAIVALLGGSRLQVTGPTAAFVVILAPVAAKFGVAGLLTAGLMAGFMLVVMGLAGMGRLIQFIPYPVTTGFTSGIAVVIATMQLKDFFGLQIVAMPESFLEKLHVLIKSFHTVSFNELFVALSTLFILVAWPKINKKIPAPFMALGIVSLGSYLLHLIFPTFDVATIGSRFSYNVDGIVGRGIPQTLPNFDWPWNLGGVEGQVFHLDLATIESLALSAFAIAMLGAIESLLSAVVADGMAQTKHDPDSELLALGIGNVICPFFGGIPATGAIARTTTNIRFGAKSPLSAVFHAIFALLVILLFAPYVSYLPMASLAALLMLVAYNMSERKHFVHILKVAPRSDMVVMLACFSLTILFDMVIGVTVGVVFASLLFMQRMAKITETHKLVSYEHIAPALNLPNNALVYEIAGPLFFGAAEKAVEAMTAITAETGSVIFVMHAVPTMDMTGLVAFESALKKLTSEKQRRVLLVGLQKQPHELLKKCGLIDLGNKQSQIFVCANLQEAAKFLGQE